ncbi:hypothetical protein Syun_025927 [Stephania yunnanensis]|uniref:Uncharacterized protein n=1 Tax=Stephania yunnanensis TaxID=152371 RepID=A0AAP0EXY4_9MAGN
MERESERSEKKERRWRRSPAAEGNAQGRSRTNDSGGGDGGGRRQHAANPIVTPGGAAIAREEARRCSSEGREKAVRGEAARQQLRSW